MFFLLCPYHHNMTLGEINACFYSINGFTFNSQHSIKLKIDQVSE